MAETSGFFKSISGDRKYTVDWLSDWVSSFISNGTYNGDLFVTPGGGLTVIVNPGKAWINGYYYQNSATLPLTIDAASGTLGRKDAVVIEWDKNNRKIAAKIIKGAPSTNPQPPQIDRNEDVYDLKIAEISVPAGVTVIKQSHIKDTRLDNAVCGIVHQMVDSIDTTNFYNQIIADLMEFRETSYVEFEEWFESIKGLLDDDAAGSLTNMINGHIDDTDVHITPAERTLWNGKFNVIFTESEDDVPAITENTLWLVPVEDS